MAQQIELWSGASRRNIPLDPLPMDGLSFDHIYLPFYDRICGSFVFMVEHVLLRVQVSITTYDP